MQTETMEIVTDVSSLKMGDLVEIVVSGDIQFPVCRHVIVCDRMLLLF